MTPVRAAASHRTVIAAVPRKPQLRETVAGADAPAPLASAIYSGWVRHRRYAPRASAFSYRLYMLYVDLDELETLFAKRWLWSNEHRNLAQFRRRDYFGDANAPLASEVRDKVFAETGVRPLGPIRLLTHLRYFGVSFNPVSFYYCFASDGVTLEAIVAHITNTPWRERHAYVLPIATGQQHGRVWGWRFDKAFHVSPFLPMQCRYDWRFSVPEENLRVHMDVYTAAGDLHAADPAAALDVATAFDAFERSFDATLVLQRHAFTPANLARVLARHPLMTIKVIAAIHWQALRIFLRGNPVYDHEDSKRRTQI